MKTILGNNLPEIAEVTLLSLEEYKECNKNINFFDLIPDEEIGSWYLQTPADDEALWVVTIEEDPPFGSGGIGLRPVIKLSSSTLKDGTILEVGDNVVIGKITLIAISNTILFSNKAIWYDKENDTYGYFDDETNIYKNSLAKKRVDAWFEAEIKPNL